MKTSLIATLLTLALAAPTFAGGGRSPFGGNNPGGNTPGGRTSALPGTTGLTGTNGLRNTPNRLTTPSGTGRQVPLTESYNILENTSIFSLTRGTPIPPPVGNGGGGGYPPPPRIAPPVFRASLVDDIGPLALLEVPDNRGNIAAVYLREGQTWNGYKVLSITLGTLNLSRAGGTTSVAIGNDLDGYQGGALPTTAGYQPADVIGTSTTATPGARPGRTGGNFRGGVNNGNPVTGVTSTLVSPSLDPPLPAGSADDIATRMANRRLNQLNATALPTTPTLPTVPAR